MANNKQKLYKNPSWPDLSQYKSVIRSLNEYPNLVFPNEIENLKSELLEVSSGKNFIIQGGDCAETFKNFSDQVIKNKLKILLQMSAIIQFTTNVTVTNIGRIAGQYIKPRSSLFETRDGLTLPSYRGDGINSIEFKQSERMPNPNNLIKAYHQSSSIMNLIRLLVMSGFTDINNIQLWNTDLTNGTKLGEKYNSIVSEIEGALRFINASLQQNPYNSSQHTNFYTSHEALLIDYEKAFIQKYNSKKYCCSGHMLWVGNRTRDPQSEQVQFLSKVDNPVGIKIGPDIKIEELQILCNQLNVKNEKGKLIFIIRLGADNIEKILPQIIKQVKHYGNEVIWFCDPMHGNTIKSQNGYKTRNFNTIVKELEYFFHILHAENIFPGGVHLELTGEKVTECLGGINNIKDVDLDERYESTCDPRLNVEQSLEVAFLISKFIKLNGVSK